MKKLTKADLILSLCVACASSNAFAQQIPPDSVLIHGKIFTGIASRPYAEAIAIQGERIVATGDTKTIQALAGPKTKIIDLHGRTAIPGINDAHHHFSLGQRKSMLIYRRRIHRGRRSRMALLSPLRRTLRTVSL